jgi:hypothetical protein
MEIPPTQLLYIIAEKGKFIPKTHGGVTILDLRTSRI